MKKNLPHLLLVLTAVAAAALLCQTGSALRFRQTAPIKAISLSQSGTSLAVGKHDTITVRVIPANSPVKWSTSNERIATVKNGTIFAVGAGKCRITASANSVRAFCTVLVHN